MSEKDTSKMVLIPGELHSAASNHIVSGSDEIYDYGFDVRQAELNNRFDASIREIATSGSDSVYDVTVKGGGENSVPSTTC